MKKSMLENTQGKHYLWITLTKNRQQRVIDKIFKHQRYLRLRIKDFPNWLTTSFALLNSDDLIGTLRAKIWSTVCRNNPFILNSLNFLTRKSESIKRIIAEFFKFWQFRGRRQHILCSQQNTVRVEQRMFK